MVDLMFLPFAERMCASLPYYKGLRVRGDPRYAPFDRWLYALEEQTAWYAGIKVRARISERLRLPPRPALPCAERV